MQHIVAITTATITTAATTLPAAGCRCWILITFAVRGPEMIICTASHRALPHPPRSFTTKQTHLFLKILAFENRCLTHFQRPTDPRPGVNKEDGDILQLSPEPHKDIS